MNLKLENDELINLDPVHLSAAEERRRTGRYVAIFVAICLVCLAIYHAWIRKVPLMASLLVPALIMLLYIAWVLYTASRDKRKALLAEADRERRAGMPYTEEGAPSLAELAPASQPLSPPIALTTPTSFKRSYSIA